MIVFDLACPDGHRFEGWFGSSADYDDQRARGLLACPHCGESYLTAKTLREIENIKRNRSNIATERPVPVAIFV